MAMAQLRDIGRADAGRPYSAPIRTSAAVGPEGRVMIGYPWSGFTPDKVLKMYNAVGVYMCIFKAKRSGNAWPHMMTRRETV